MAEGEVVPADVSTDDLRQEANLRARRAGYPVTRTKGRIMTTVPFGERKYNLWPRDENGRLIDD